MSSVTIDGYSVYIGSVGGKQVGNVVCSTLVDPLTNLVNTCGNLQNGDVRAGGTAWVPGLEGRTYIYPTDESK